MKTVTIDLKSFFFGTLTMGAILLMAYKPAAQPQSPTQPQPYPDNRRYQAFVGKDTRTIILDTQTGRFLLERPAVGLPGWAPLDFEELHRGRQNR